MIVLNCLHSLSVNLIYEMLCTYQCNRAPLPHTRAEVGEGGDLPRDLHLRKIQIPTYWGSCPCIIPGITPSCRLRG